MHRARLADGAEVAVKVRHADIEKRVEVDTDILVGLADSPAASPSWPITARKGPHASSNE